MFKKIKFILTSAYENIEMLLYFANDYMIIYF